MPFLGAGKFKFLKNRRGFLQSFLPVLQPLILHDETILGDSSADVVELVVTSDLQASPLALDMSFSKVPMKTTTMLHHLKGQKNKSL